MKKLVFLFSALLLLASCSKSFKVNVEYDSDYKGQVYLINYDTNDTIAVATLEGNKCTFEGTFDKPFLARFSDDGLHSYPMCYLVVDEGETTINIDKEGYFKASGPLNKKLWDDCYGNAIGTLISTQDYEQYYKEYLKYYEENKDNLAGQWAFCQYLGHKGLSEAEIDALLKEAPAEYAQLKYIERQKNIARQKELTKVGKKYVDFEITDKDGKTQKLSDYIGKEGRKTLLFFFWPSNIAQDPTKGLLNELQQITDSRSSGGISVVGVPVYDNPEVTARVIEETGIKFPVIIGKQALYKPLELYGLYQSAIYMVLIDENGDITDRGSKFSAIMRTEDDVKIIIE